MIMYDKEKGITQVLGFITGQPIFTTDDDGNKVLSFDVFRTDKWMEQKTGEMKEVDYTHHCVMKGNKAEFASKYLLNRTRIFVEGTEQELKEKTVLNVSIFRLLADHK